MVRRVITERVDAHAPISMAAPCSTRNAPNIGRASNSAPRKQGLIASFHHVESLYCCPKRIAKQALSLWTTRVIEVKLREYEVAQRYDTTMKG